MKFLRKITNNIKVGILDFFKGGIPADFFKMKFVYNVLTIKGVCMKIFILLLTVLFSFFSLAEDIDSQDKTLQKWDLSSIGADSDTKGSSWPIEFVVRSNIDKRKNRPSEGKDSYFHTTYVAIKNYSKNKKKLCTVQDIYDVDQVTGLDPENKEKKIKVKKCEYVKMEGYCYKKESKAQCDKELGNIFQAHMTALSRY